MKTAGSDDSPPERRPVHGRAQRSGKITTLVLAPLLLVILLTVGMRLASHLAQAAAAREEARVPAALAEAKANGKSGGKKRKLPLYVPKPANSATQKGVETCVRGQIEAIARGDYRTALDFSVPQFRANFSPERFGQMVTSGYPVMAEARSVTFEPATAMGMTFANVRVHISGVSGAKAGYLYQMVRDDDGNWGVASVAPTDPPPGFSPQGGPPPSGGKGQPGQPGRSSYPIDLRDV